MKRLPLLTWWLLPLVASGGVVPAGPALAREDARGQRTTDEKIEEVDQRIRILERRQELEKEKAAEQAKDAGAVNAGKDGFVITSADGGYQLRLRALVQLDGRFFIDDRLKPATDTFLLRRVRPIVEATLAKIFSVRIVPDFGVGATVLQDAYLDARFSPVATVRAGKFKTPFGLERLQSASDLIFVERALPTNLVPNRDLGIQVHGEVAKGVFAYAAGIFNGVPDGGSADADTNDGKDEAVRLFVQPFKGTSISWLQGLGVGIAATRGRNLGTPTATGLAAYKTAGQQTFFAYLSNTSPTPANTVVADGLRKRLSPQLYCYAGWFGLLGEYVTSSQEVEIGTTRETLENTSWQSTASFLLTRDRASYKGVDPKKPYDPAAGSFSAGAIEIAARYGRLKIDDQAFPLLADPTKSAREATEWSAGFNWYLNKNVKAMLDYSRTTFDGGSATGDREDEKVVFSRFQIAF